MSSKMSEQMMELLKDTLPNMDTQTGETLEHTSRLAGYLAYSAVNSLKIESDYLNKVRESSTLLEVEAIKKEIVKPRIIIPK